MDRLFKLIGAASGWGAQNHDTEMGPRGFRKYLTTINSKIKFHRFIKSIKSINDEQIATDDVTLLNLVVRVCKHLIKVVSRSISLKQFPIIIGGDHSLAIGTWSAVIHELDAYQTFGLIWIDAHMDSHTYETSPSKAYHGMSLSALLGFGAIELTNMLSYQAKVNPKHVCVIGARSYEPEEEELLRNLGVKIFYIDEVKKRGFQQVFVEAKAIVKKGTKFYGVSLDLDAFDPKFAPGVGSVAENGLDPEDVITELVAIAHDPHLRALEIMEFNPERDRNNKTVKVIYDLVTRFIG